LAKPSDQPRPAWSGWWVFAALLAFALALRLPLLHSADATFNSDEAVNALGIEHALHGELRLSFWDASYYGIVEGLLALPFVPFFGTTAVAFRLGAVAGFLLAIAGCGLLARRLFGRGAEAAALLVVVAGSTDLVRWSAIASGGYFLVVACGAFAVLAFLAADERPSPARWLLAGGLATFGLYVYELHLVTLAGLGVACAARLVHTARPQGTTWRDGLRGLRGLGRRWTWFAWFTAGAVLGLGPKVLARLLEGTGSKKPLYDLSLELVSRNVRLLGESILRLVGRGSVSQPDHLAWERAVSTATLALWLGIALVAIVGTVRASMTATPRARALIALAFSVAADGAGFLLSGNAQDALASRYLLPSLVCLAVWAGALVGESAPAWARRPAWAGLALLAAAQAASIAFWAQEQGTLDGTFRLRRRDDEATRRVLEALTESGDRTAYSWYWFSYRATFLAEEKVIVAPVDWPRYLPYQRAAADAPRDVHVIPLEAIPLAVKYKQEFENRLAGSGRESVRQDIGAYRLYRARDGGRLLGAFGVVEPRKLERPAADLRRADDRPVVAIAGQVTGALVDVTNRSDLGWSATGRALLGNQNVVAMSYRWQSPDGRFLTDYGERSLLLGDVEVGETQRLVVRATAPVEPGNYLLYVTLVQENVAWFDQAGGSHLAIPLRVEPAAATPAPPALEVTAPAAKKAA
jgi:hypothetical protein